MDILFIRSTFLISVFCERADGFQDVFESFSLRLAELLHRLPSLAAEKMWQMYLSQAAFGII
jgi:hypothetical protein